MNKNNFVLAAALLMTLVSCSQDPDLPENPQDKEEYRDQQGNQWIYNAMLMRWALMPSPYNGLSTTHYYYPNSHTWQDAQGRKVEAPAFDGGTKNTRKSGRVFGSQFRSRSVPA